MWELVAFSLPVFPDGALQGSVMIPIFVGVVLMTLAAERFGWTFSGIVVPGYLVPIIMVAPWSAGIIVIEAALTILVVHFLTVTLFRAGWWPPLFGRDKFMLILLVSVLVRLVLELGLLPRFGEYLQTINPYFDYQNRFKAVGLVVVPLMANMVWKAGILRGFVHVGLITGATLAVVMLLVVPLTNYSIGYFYYIYEVAALEFAASPAAYIILLLGAFLASRANLYLGWDFSGIMVPTLLALALLTPLRFGLTIVEAIVIMLACRRLVLAPGFRRINWEGPRLVCLLFGLSLVLKLVVGHSTELVVPGFPYEGLFAYGYLLSTLMAMKMYQRDVVVQVSAPVVGVSVAIVVAAHLVVQGLTGVERRPLEVAGDLLPQRSTAAGPQLTERSPFDLLQEERSRILRPGGAGRYVPPLPAESMQYRALCDLVGRLVRDRGVHEPDLSWQAAQAMAGDCGCELLWLPASRTIQRPLVVLRETGVDRRRRGWGTVIWATGRSRDSILAVPRPLTEAGSLEVGLVCLERLQGHCLVIAGAHPDTNEESGADVLRRPGTPFALALQTYATHSLVEIRTLAPPSPSQCWVAGALPANVPVAALTRVLPELAIRLPPARPPAPNELLRRTRRPAHLALALRPEDVQEVMADHYGGGRSASTVAWAPEPVNLRRELRQLLERQRQAALGPVRQLGLDELAVWEHAVLRPLARLALDEARQGELGRHLLGLREAAAENGFSLRYLADVDGDRYVVLAEELDADRAGHGLVCWRLGLARPLHLLAPLPQTLPGTAQVAVELALQTEARCVSIAGLGRAPPGRPARDRLLRQRTASWYQLVFQVAQQSGWRHEPLLGVEVLGSDDLPLADDLGVVVQQANLIGGRAALASPALELCHSLEELGIEVLVHDGRAALAHLSLPGNPQYGYAHAHHSAWFAGVWLDRGARRRLASGRPPDGRVLAWRRMGLLATDSAAGLIERGRSAVAQAPMRATESTERVLAWLAQLEDLRGYLADDNLLRFERLRRRAVARDFFFALADDPDADRVVAVLVGRFGQAAPQAVVVNLAPLTERERSADWAGWQAALPAFLADRAALLQIGEGGAAP